MKKVTFEEYKAQQYEMFQKRDPAIKTIEEVELYPSFWAVWEYMRAHELYLKGEFYEARLISQKAARETGIEIHPGAVIGENFFVDHGHGVVIGETAIIGDNVTLYQQVTLGGTGKEHGKRHPTVGNNVMIGAGAKVLGSITIGDDVKVGAGSVVVSDVPSGTTVVGVPARIIAKDNIKVEVEELDQVDMPDPVNTDIEELKNETKSICEKIAEVEELIEKLKAAYCDKC